LRQQDSEIRFKDAKIEKITFQLARLKAWKFGAKTEAMSAEQRRLFEETLAEDEASLQAQLDQARGTAAPPAATVTAAKRKPVVDHCPNTCAAKTTTTSPRTPTARTRSAAVRWCASGKT
jgi:transposase